MPCTPEPEAELLARCRAGDQEAFRRLVERHHQQVYRTAYAVTADAGAAGEITQETFVKAWRGLGGFRGDAALATWLTRLALNAARDHLRRQRAGASWRAVRSLATLPPRDDDMARIVEDRDEVQRALERLSPQAREVVALRYGLDLSLREIAAVLGCPEGTVKSRLNAALGKLRTILRQERTATG